MPLLGGMTVFVVAVVALLMWLVFGGSTGKQRGLVVINLRSTEVVLTLDDGQTTHLKPSESATVFAVRADFPQTLHITGTDGTPIFEQRVDYSSLVDAEFRIAIGDDRIVLPVKPPGS
jgi:hypothetical protein